MISSTRVKKRGTKYKYDRCMAWLEFHIATSIIIKETKRREKPDQRYSRSIQFPILFIF